jgi:Fic family protein
VQLETPARIEPCLLESYPSELADVLAELVAASAKLGARLHPTSASSLAELVRVMNCYYSNLIEGHNTRPRDIERALADDLHADEQRRDLQIEARAHIRLQREIDAACAAGSYGEPAATQRICWLHREFYRDAPARMLTIRHRDGDYQMVPGELRSEPRHEVAVGRHLPPSSARVPEFMAYFEQRYRFEKLGGSARIVAMAAAHHRLNYIHPFVDGNGRVSRLMSHAMGLQAGIGAHGLWSISRGLARGLGDPGEYKRMMDDADSPRRGGLGGRGNHSHEAHRVARRPYSSGPTNSCGNSTSALATEKFSRPGPYGVSDCNSPACTSAPNIARPVRSDLPVTCPASPRGNSPRRSASRARRSADSVIPSVSRT